MMIMMMIISKGQHEDESDTGSAWYWDVKNTPGSDPIDENGDRFEDILNVVALKKWKKINKQQAKTNKKKEKDAGKISIETKQKSVNSSRKEKN